MTDKYLDKWKDPIYHIDEFDYDEAINFANYLVYERGAENVCMDFVNGQFIIYYKPVTEIKNVKLDVVFLDKENGEENDKE